MALCAGAWSSRGDLCGMWGETGDGRARKEKVRRRVYCPVLESWDNRGWLLCTTAKLNHPTRFGFCREWTDWAPVTTPPVQRHPIPGYCSCVAEWLRLGVALLARALPYPDLVTTIVAVKLSSK